jgi:iron complex outermembrane receptor protein
VPVNDANSAAAGSYEVANLRAGWTGMVAGWKLDAFGRLENIFDTDYVGSVIVNEGNQRFYEPAPGRAGFIGFTARRSL